MSNEGGQGKPRGRRRNTAADALAAVGPVGDPTRPKNTQADREFIKANVMDFRHIDGNLVWSGRAEDIGSPYQLPPEGYRCSRQRVMHDDDGGQILDVDRNPLKDRCPRWAMRGTDLCIDHAKGSKAVLEEVRKRIVGAADAIAGAMLEIAFDRDLPAADRLKAMNSLMDRGGLKAGVELSADVDSWSELRAIWTQDD
jgi:hypothetical protein